MRWEYASGKMSQLMQKPAVELYTIYARYSRPPRTRSREVFLRFRYSPTSSKCWIEIVNRVNVPRLSPQGKVLPQRKPHESHW